MIKAIDATATLRIIGPVSSTVITIYETKAKYLSRETEPDNQNTETQLFIKVYVCNVSVPLKLKRCIRRINKLYLDNEKSVYFHKTSFNFFLIRWRCCHTKRSKLFI
jgi:hypothetical protein